MSKEEKDTADALARIEKDFGALRTYLEQMVFLQKEILNKLGQERAIIKENVDSSLDAAVLLKFPDHLRKTMIALSRVIDGRADEVAKITGRARAIESGYLNQLVRMGYVKKMRRKHQIYFSIQDGYNHG
jgi:Zn-dependent M32 family carboxypeptidase